MAAMVLAHSLHCGDWSTVRDYCKPANRSGVDRETVLGFNIRQTSLCGISKTYCLERCYGKHSMKICTIAKCGREVSARGWCNTHYWQNYAGREPGSEGERARAARLRKEAEAAGKKTYETGKPCPQGHIAPRRLSGHCVVCINEKTKKRYAKNPEKMRKATALWVQRNADRMKELKRNWALENRASKNEHAARRRACEKRAMPKWADRSVIKEIYKEAKRLGMEVDHIVPIQGVNVCGLHVPANLQLLPRFDNRSKGNKLVMT